MRGWLCPESSVRTLQQLPFRVKEEAAAALPTRGCPNTVCREEINDQCGFKCEKRVIEKITEYFQFILLPMPNKGNPIVCYNVRVAVRPSLRGDQESKGTWRGFID